MSHGSNRIAFCLIHVWGKVVKTPPCASSTWQQAWWQSEYSEPFTHLSIATLTEINNTRPAIKINDAIELFQCLLVHGVPAHYDNQAL